jgi:pimeloyl-ACP methyl ester carboxylesterase
VRILKWIGLGLLVVLALAIIGFVAWGSTPSGPMPEAMAAMRSDAKVQVGTGPWITFSPVGVQPTTGFIFYPGGHVDARAYAPMLRQIAERGALVVLVPMPLNLAVFGVNRADQVIEAHPEIEHWVIGGHSLGGAMASAYVHGKPDAVDGLALWASYPADNNSLANRDLKTTSIYGTNDGQAAKIPASKALLPASTTFVPIDGGNHAQFGWYGAQAGDGQAAISREAQRAQIVDATTALLASLGSK